MKILILTGKFGMGHWSASCALQQQLEQEGHQVETVDFFDYAMPELAPTLYRMFGWLVKYGGGLYNLFHRLTRNVEGEMPLAGGGWTPPHPCARRWWPATKRKGARCPW